MTKNNCIYCSPSNRLVIFTGITSQLLVPKRMHIKPEDGGHLIVSPLRHLRRRINLSVQELLEIDYLSILSTRLLEVICEIDEVNYQENGNWTTALPDIQHLHLHVYGRRKDSTAQPFGEALRFPYKAELENWRVSGFSDAQIDRMKTLILNIQNESWSKKFLQTITLLSK